MMKGKLLLITALFASTVLWAAEGGMTKDEILNETKAGCLQSGNTEQACECSIKGFDERMSKEEWDLVVKPSQQMTEQDIATLQAISKKMFKVAEECGATK